MRAKIGLYTALWGRHELASKVLNYYNQFDLLKVAVGSEGDKSRSVAESAGWNYIEHPNNVHDKFQAGMEWFRDKDVDGIVLIGSDDILSPSYFDLVESVQDTRFDRIQLNQFYFTNGEEASLCSGMMFGAGRYFSRHLLEAMDYKGWSGGRHKSPDHSSEYSIFPYERYVLHVNDLEKAGIYAVDIKTSQNVWSYKQVTDACRFEPSNMNQIISYIGTDLYQYITSPQKKKASCKSYR